MRKASTRKAQAEEVPILKVVVLDIDGVLTDGTVWINDQGHEYKRIHYRDLDALSEMVRQGYVLGFVTGESTPIVDYLCSRLPHRYFYRGCKDKQSALKEIVAKEGITPQEVCYIGDGRADLPAIHYAGFGVCPADAAPEVRSQTDHVLQSRGGNGAIAELVRLLQDDLTLT